MGSWAIFLFSILIVLFSKYQVRDGRREAAASELWNIIIVNYWCLYWYYTGNQRSNKVNMFIIIIIIVYI